MADRIAFVTGGSGAIGGDICRRLAKEGFKVVVGYNENFDAASTLVELLNGVGFCAMALKCDVTSYESVCSAKAKVNAVWGAVDTVVNCAGSEAYRLLCDETAESINETVAVDFTAAIYLCRAFTPSMVSEGFGRVVNISSVWGVCGASMETVYSGAKAGVIGFSKALALELAPSGVTVNTVSPGYIDTPMNCRFTKAERDALREEIPAGRFGKPSDVSAAVSFLVSADSGYVTGQNVVVSGGWKI